MARLRPIESERGPNNKGPNPIPRKKATMTSCHIVALCHTEIAADLGQRRQHRIGGERGKRHHERDQRPRASLVLNKGRHNRTCGSPRAERLVLHPISAPLPRTGDKEIPSLAGSSFFLPLTAVSEFQVMEALAVFLTPGTARFGQLITYTSAQDSWDPLIYGVSPEASGTNR